MASSLMLQLLTSIAVASVVTAAPDLSICDPSNFTYPYDGPPLPTLPSQYRLKVEANIGNRGYSFILEEFYDEINNRGASVSKRDGTTRYTSYDYKLNQTVEVKMDHETGMSSCSVRNFSRFSLFGFHIENGTGHINGTDAVFQFGKEYNETYMGTTTVRGIPANHWQRCIYHSQANKTYRLDFYFSNASFHLQSGPNAIPLRATIYGSALNRTTQEMRYFNHNYEYLEVEPGPVTMDRAFEPPLGVVCAGYKRVKKFPDFPMVFGMNAELVFPKWNLVHNAMVYYNYPANLTAYIYEPFGNSSKNATMVREVHDFNAGLAYKLEHGTDRCTVGPIPIRPFFSDTESPDGKHVTLKSPYAYIFQNESSWIYEGNTSVRNVDAEAWITAGQHVNGSSVMNFTMEYFFARGNWTGGTNKTGLVHQMPLQFKYTSSGMYEGKTISFNMTESIYHFTYHIPDFFFDVHRCFNTKDSRYMAVEIVGPVQDIRQNYIENNTHNFYSAVQHAIANASGLPASRIGNVYAAESLEDVLVVYFEMLGIPPVEGNAVNPKHGPDLAKAITTLEERVLQEEPIPINFTKDGKNVTLIIARGSLRIDFHPPSDDGNKGLSTGTAAGVGIGMFLLGAIIASFIAVVYVKRIMAPPVPYGVQE